MTPTERKRALALVDKIRTFDKFAANSAIRRTMADPLSAEQLNAIAMVSENTGTADLAHAELRKLLRDPP